jgi:hypothetical protein
MGALRAAELHGFGMRGVGRIFELYRDGEVEDDDEVAVLHGPADAGYRASSEAMVNIRDRLQAAQQAGFISDHACAQVIALAKAMPYAMRSYPALLALALAPELGLTAQEHAQLSAFLAQPAPSLKERDAIAVLERLAHDHDAPATPGFRLERSIFFERLRLEVAREAAGAARGADIDERDSQLALLAILAREHAVLPQAGAGQDEVEQATQRFLAARGLRDPEAIERFLQASGLSAQRLRALIGEQLTIERLALQYRPEIEQRLLDWLRLQR